jgi:hypothetical protein
LRSSLFGGDDLLVGGKGKGGKANDPAPGEFDLLGAKADAAVPVIAQVGGWAAPLCWLDRGRDM